MVLSAATGSALAAVASLIGSFVGVQAYKRNQDRKRENTPWFEWTEEDTAEFISSLGRTERWHIHYSALVFRHDIDGHTLQRSSTDDLQDIGFTPRDANKVIKAFAKKVKLVGFPVEQSPSYKSKKRHRRKKKRRKRSRRHSRHSSDEN